MLSVSIYRLDCTSQATIYLLLMPGLQLSVCDFPLGEFVWRTVVELLRFLSSSNTYDNSHPQTDTSSWTSAGFFRT